VFRRTSVCLQITFYAVLMLENLPFLLKSWFIFCYERGFYESVIRSYVWIRKVIYVGHNAIHFLSGGVSIAKPEFRDFSKLLWSLTFWSLLVTWCTNRYNIQQFTFCPQCTSIDVFCTYLRTNSNLGHLQHKLIGFYGREEKCLLRGTNWVSAIRQIGLYYYEDV
jgi:hypothetical protein